MPRMNKKTLLNAVFPIPSLELQHQRIDLLSSIEKARTKAELLIQQLDTLVKSRFGGMLHLLNSLSGIMHASFFSVADTD